MPRYYRPRPAADYAGTSASTLAKRRMAGLPPRYAKIGNRIIYDQADLDEWIRSERRLSTSDPGQGELRHTARRDEPGSSKRATAAPRDHDAEEAEPCPYLPAT
jgi:hypothetical protein